MPDQALSHTDSIGQFTWHNNPFINELKKGRKIERNFEKPKGYMLNFIFCRMHGDLSLKIIRLTQKRILVILNSNSLPTWSQFENRFYPLGHKLYMLKPFIYSVIMIRLPIIILSLIRKPERKIFFLMVRYERFERYQTEIMRYEIH